MGYLDALKKFENAPPPYLQNHQNHQNGGFVGFEGTTSPDSQISAEGFVGFEGTPPPRFQESLERFADTDRRTCRDCLNLEADGGCRAARRGEIPMASRHYRHPDVEALHRCVGYRPCADDPDQRHGRDRWPNLYRRLLAKEVTP